jgi:hypothetical protein
MMIDAVLKKAKNFQPNENGRIGTSPAKNAIKNPATTTSGPDTTAVGWAGSCCRIRYSQLETPSQLLLHQARTVCSASTRKEPELVTVNSIQGTA